MVDASLNKALTRERLSYGKIAHAQEGATNMIGAYFSPVSMNAAQYEDVLRRLEAAGHGKPKGRLHHSSFGPEDHLMVFDIYDSQENFEAFGAVLMPILAEVGIDPGTPDVMPVYKVIKGD